MKNESSYPNYSMITITTKIVFCPQNVHNKNWRGGGWGRREKSHIIEHDATNYTGTKNDASSIKKK